MPLDTSYIVASSGTRNRAVLVSERTQDIIMAALTNVLSRGAWDDMDDSAWDDFESYLTQAQIEILNIVSGGGMSSIRQAKRNVLQAIAGSGEYALVFNSGDYDTTHNTRIYASNSGNHVVSATIRMANGTTRDMNAFIRKNGTQVIASSELSAGLQRTHSISAVVDLLDSDYLELIATVNGSCSIVVSPVNPVLSMVHIP